MATTTKKFDIKKMTPQQLQPIILAAVLVVMLLVFTIMNPNFITWTNLHTILLTAVTVGIITIGQSVCKLANYFDMSVGLVGAMGGLAAAMVLEAGGSAFMAVLAGLAVGFWKDIADIKLNWGVNRVFTPSMEEVRRKELIRGWHKAVKCALVWADDEE